MRKEIEAVVKFLAQTVGEDDMASLQINNEGKIILRIGVSYSKHLSVDELVAMMAIDEHTGKQTVDHFTGEYFYGERF